MVRVVCVLFIMRRLNVVSGECRLCFVYYEEAECYLNRNFEQFLMHYCRTSEFPLLCFRYFDPHYVWRR